MMEKKYYDRKEIFAVKEMKALYDQMIQIGVADTAYRRKLVISILQKQKEDGSFRVIEDTHCPSDYAVDYIYFPTYYATAALITAVNCEELKEDAFVDHYKNALTRGLKVVIGKRLCGHGFESTAQRLQALNIYKKAGLYDFLRDNKKEYCEFYEMIQGIIESFRLCLAENRVFGM